MAREHAEMIFGLPKTRTTKKMRIPCVAEREREADDGIYIMSTG